MNTNDYKANIERVLLGYYIKYDKLFELTNKAFVNASSNDIDIYIDIYDMLKPVYTTNVYANNQYTVVSSIINVAAHMREYFWSRHRVNTRIFLVYGDCTTLNHKQFYMSFGDDDYINALNFNKMNSVIASQLEMIKILCAYIYGVYLVKRTTDFSMFVYDNIIKNKQIPALLITKSKYAYQIPALCENAVIYRPKKYDGQDISYYIDNTNVLNMFFDKIKSSKSIELLKELNPSMLSLLITMNGLPQKKLLTLFNSTSAINKVHDAVINLRINNAYNPDVDYMYNALQIADKIDPSSFKCRYNAVDLIFQHMVYTNTVESKDISWNIDLQDRKTIHAINNKYFVDNPLDLNSL